MNDKLIRSALLQHLSATDPSAVIYHELPLSRGEGRADCAAVNGSLTGFEIKSEKDSLSRLGKQVRDYGQVFDYCYIVVAKKHVSNARQIVPKNWGIIVAEYRDDVVLSVRRKARRNSHTCHTALTRLLWRREASSALRRNGIACKPNALIEEVWESFRKLPRNVIACEVRHALKARGGSEVVAR